MAKATQSLKSVVFKMFEEGKSTRQIPQMVDISRRTVITFRKEWKELQSKKSA